ncbi:hypothetical protein DM02DRAFT_136968 [Periconia macrospinosa]|uniref:Secreted protein n=1 Tax=Periconia macrospinosa TaxID=97972 RepID=A0A2V1DCZ0_9PLEO|nr:hypothetical protein DM02DRAFT_136968 [Periconia macrospinosa]
MIHHAPPLLFLFLLAYLLHGGRRTRRPRVSKKDWDGRVIFGDWLWGHVRRCSLGSGVRCASRLVIGSESGSGK